MFRPRRELRLFGTVPIRHILLVVLVLVEPAAVRGVVGSLLSRH